MKKLAIALVLLIALAAVISYNVWRADQNPVTSTPGLLEVGRQHLHAQLEQARQQEAQVEKQAWNSPAQLRFLIQAHQHRMDQLNGNSQAGEILSYDRDCIARLEKRIADLAAQQAAQAQALQETPSAAPPPKAAAKP